MKGEGSEINDDGFGEARCFEVVDHLGFLAAADRSERLEFDDDVTEADEIGAVGGVEWFASILDRQRMFSFVRQAKCHKFSL